MAGVAVREVRADEHTAVAALTVAAYDRVGRVSDEYRATLGDVAARQDPDTRVLVAVADGEVLGSVTVVGGCSQHFEHAGHGDGGFRMLAVAPGVQGRGVGRALLGAALHHGRDAGWRRLVITTMAWMDGAQRLYESHGFTRRPDLDVRFRAGVGLAYQHDLVPDAAAAFPAPGPVPDEPPAFLPREDRPAGC